MATILRGQVCPLPRAFLHEKKKYFCYFDDDCAFAGNFCQDCACARGKSRKNCGTEKCVAQYELSCLVKFSRGSDRRQKRNVTRATFYAKWKSSFSQDMLASMKKGLEHISHVKRKLTFANRPPATAMSGKVDIITKVICQMYVNPNT